MNNLMKVSPDLKRYIPGQKTNNNTPKNLKRENEEKEEEENKIRGRTENNSLITQKINPDLNLNIKNILNVQVNDFANLLSKNLNTQNAALIVRTAGQELDRLLDKLVLNIKESKNSNSHNLKLNLNLENIFKRNISNIINIQSISTAFNTNGVSEFHINSEINMIKLESLKDDSNKVEPTEIKFIGKKRENEALILNMQEDSIIADLTNNSNLNNFKLNNGQPPPRNIFKTQKLDNTASTINITSISNTPSLQNGQTSQSLQRNNAKKLSVFDKFFILFKKTCYPVYQVEADISADKKEFTFKYKKKNPDTLPELHTLHTVNQIKYQILYDQETQKIRSLEKFINENSCLKLNNDEEINKSEIMSHELQAMLKDILKNVDKKQLKEVLNNS